MTEQNTSTESQKDFTEILKELAGYEEFFKEEEKTKELVDWVHEETGINKLSIRLAIKHVAPLVIGAVEKAAGMVADSWKAKLHERLSRSGPNSWYFRLSESLLNILKTRTDKSLDNAFQHPDKDSLNTLLNDNIHWANLKAEQQGLIQILNQLMKLNFQLELKTPDYFQQAMAEQPPEKGTAQWLTYTSRQADLVGRETELHLLDQFLNQNKNFSWWAVTGEGGVGKSRLALEALIRHHLWYGGFLPEYKLDKPDALSQWQPSCPTVIVIDYAAKHAESVAQWIDQLQQKQNDFKFPVRLLILERHYKEQNWWEKILIPATSDGLARQRSLYQIQPQELQPLGKTDQKQALDGFLKALGKRAIMPKPADSFWQVLSDLSENGRPLFIAMTAVALANKGKQGMKDWNHNDLLDYVLSHEQSCWDNQLKDQSAAIQQTAKDLLVISTLISGFNWEQKDQIQQHLAEAGIITAQDNLETLWPLTTTLAGHEGGYLQPDLFAEYYLLTQLPLKSSGPGSKSRDLLHTAFKIDPDNLLDTLGRCALDYSDDKTSLSWWNSLNDAQLSEDFDLTEWCFDLVGQMMLAGKYQVTLNIWLPMLFESKEQQIQAIVLNLKGLCSDYLGHYKKALEFYQHSISIRKEIGDQMGEATTLNNISQIYKAKGDYDTTLKYLKQSFSIIQETRDRSGAGVALNNIGQIYYVREDYDTALQYLKQSLFICQEAGDKSGEGTLLNNIAQIYKARGDYDTAQSHLKQSLSIQQEIGDKFGEGSTLNNMAGIAYSVGENDIALRYLESSLAIKQEIGDRSGICTTLFNIGHIHLQNHEIEQAINKWLTVYVLASKMSLAQSLDALTELAPQLGMNNGLSGWQQLLEEKQAEGWKSPYLESLSSTLG